MGEKRQLQLRKILKHLYFGRELSSTEVSIEIGKSIPSTIKLLNELIKAGFVLETGHAPSTGGRRPLRYSLKADVMYIITVAMDQFVTRIGLMDLNNHHIRDIEKFELPLANNANALQILINDINEFIDRAEVSKSKIIGVGIGMPGFVDADKGANYSFFEANEQSISKVVGDATGLPVFIDNDSSLVALAEQKFGAARNKRNAMVINIGWGIGLGLVLNGELFRGFEGFAGEFSHIPLFTNNKLCSCGKTGCLETEASLLVVVEKAVRELKNGRVSLLLQKDFFELKLEDACNAIIQASKQGDQFAAELLSETGYNIGRGVAVLIHLLNPEVIILSGRGSLAGKVWKAPIQHALNEQCIPRLAASTEIAVSELGYEAELIGAAALVMECFEKGAMPMMLQHMDKEEQVKH